MVNSGLMELLVCPDCRGALESRDSGLSCTSCAREYEVIDDIPVLYPAHLDMEHLREEEHLAAPQEPGQRSAALEFRSWQWGISKKEFWSMVEDTIRASNGGEIPVGKTMANIGCGSDIGFIPFQEQGIRFVNFDIVRFVLNRLMREHGAEHCVAGDIGSLPFRDEAFDYLVTLDVIHHECEHMEEILASLMKLIKPGGTLFLRDPNAWGLFHFMKGVLLPRPVHGALRRLYHKLKRSAHKPADYEFPTGIWTVIGMLERLGFVDIRVYPNTAYASSKPYQYAIYKILSKCNFISKYHSYHYTISAVKP